MTYELRLARRFVTASLCAAPLALAAACGGAKENVASPASPAAASAAPAASAASGATGSGSLTGRVTFEGAVPASETIKLSSDAACAGQHPHGMSKGDLLVSPDKGIGNVFVYVKEGIAGTYPVPAAPVVLDQQGCAYHPHVFGVRAGQPIEIVNSDDTTHNVHAIAEKNASFNLGMPTLGQRISKTFTKPEVMVKFKCDVHGWMSAWAGVLMHPFFSVTAPDGSFTIKDLPAGTYTVEAWHERLGTRSQTVTLGQKESGTLGFTFRAPG